MSIAVSHGGVTASPSLWAEMRLALVVENYGIDMGELRLHMWERSWCRVHSYGGAASGMHVPCRARNYLNSYDEKKREDYSARGLAKVNTTPKNIPAVKILNDPLPKCDGGFSYGARFKRDEFSVMMQQGVVTEGTRIFVDGEIWLIVPTSSNGGKSQRKTRVEV